MDLFRYLPIDKKLSLHWRQYVLQSLYATMAVFLVLLLLHMQRAVIIASIGASAFIVFAMPQSITAKRRNLVGGHVIAGRLGVWPGAAIVDVAVHGPICTMCGRNDIPDGGNRHRASTSRRDRTRSGNDRRVAESGAIGGDEYLGIGAGASLAQVQIAGPGMRKSTPG
jgi:hypothetical protein